MIYIFASILMAILFIAVLWCGVLIYRFGFNDSLHYNKSGNLDNICKQRQDENDFKTTLDKDFEELMKFTGDTVPIQTDDLD